MKINENSFHIYFTVDFFFFGDKKTLLDLGSKVHRTFIPLCLKQKSSHYYNEVRKFSRFNEPPNLFASKIIVYKKREEK